METTENIKKRLSDIEVACSKVTKEFYEMSEKNIPYDVALKWYESQPVIKEKERLENELRLIETPKYFEPIESDDDVYTIGGFIECCRDGGLFTDYDGFGVYAFEDKKSDIKIYPSDVTNGNIRKDFTHVVWYNK